MKKNEPIMYCILTEEKWQEFCENYPKITKKHLTKNNTDDIINISNEREVESL